MLKILKNRFFQFLLGVLLSIYFVGAFLWGMNVQVWFNEMIKVNSVWIMTLIYLIVFWGIRSFSLHLHRLGFRHIFPLFIFVEVMILFFVTFLGIEYSEFYLMSSSLVMLAILFFFDYVVAIFDKKVIAYIPLGIVEELPNVPNITWKKLESNKSINKQEIDIVIADLRTELSDEWLSFLVDCTLQHIPVYHSVKLFEMVFGRVRIDHMYENDLVSLLPSKSYQIIKRIFDVGIILFSLPLILPIMIITSLLIVIESRGRVFFLQERVGQEGKLFTMYKFRSMYSGTATDTTTGDEDERITKVGKFIRKTRIDELPQFFNVLKGEMSLIGPRPEQKDFVKDFNNEIPFYNYRHIVKPGISGWAQVVQGYVADADETKIKLEHDFYYIKNFSFSMDLLIFFKTIETIFTGFGAK